MSERVLRHSEPVAVLASEAQRVILLAMATGDNRTSKLLGVFALLINYSL